MISIHQHTDYENLNFQQSYRQYYDDLGITDFKHWDRLFDDMAKEENFNTYLLVKEDTIIGFIQCQTIELTHWFFKEHCGFIREFWVSKANRKQGHGDTLFNVAIKTFKAQKLKKAILTSEKTERFYTNRGFTCDNSYHALNKDTVYVKSI